MAALDIKLDDNQLRSIIGESLLRAIDDKTREGLIKHALEALLKPTYDNLYGRQESPIERAFLNAIRGMAEKEAARLLGEDETVRTRIRELIAEATARALADREKIVSRIARAIADSLGER